MPVSISVPELITVQQECANPWTVTQHPGVLRAYKVFNGVEKAPTMRMSNTQRKGKRANAGFIYGCTKCSYMNDRLYHTQMHHNRIHVQNGRAMLCRRKFLSRSEKKDILPNVSVHLKCQGKIAYASRKATQALRCVFSDTASVSLSAIEKIPGVVVAHEMHKQKPVLIFGETSIIWQNVGHKNIAKDVAKDFTPSVMQSNNAATAQRISALADMSIGFVVTDTARQRQLYDPIWSAHESDEIFTQDDGHAVTSSSNENNFDRNGSSTPDCFACNSYFV